MPATKAGSPFMALRKATPLLPFSGILNSSRSSKSPYSSSVINQPPPCPLTKRTPFSAPHTSILPPSLTFHPLRSLPLKRALNPSGALLSSAVPADKKHKVRVKVKNKDVRFMFVLSEWWGQFRG